MHIQFAVLTQPGLFLSLFHFPLSLASSSHTSSAAQSLQPTLLFHVQTQPNPNNPIPCVVVTFFVCVCVCVWWQLWWCQVLKSCVVVLHSDMPLEASVFVLCGRVSAALCVRRGGLVVSTAPVQFAINLWQPRCDSVLLLQKFLSDRVCFLSSMTETQAVINNTTLFGQTLKWRDDFLGAAWITESKRKGEVEKKEKEIDIYKCWHRYSCTSYQNCSLNL